MEIDFEVTNLKKRSRSSDLNEEEYPLLTKVFDALGDQCDDETNGHEKSWVRVPATTTLVWTMKGISNVCLVMAMI